MRIYSKHILILFCCSVFLTPYTTGANTAVELENKIESQNKAIEVLEAEIAAYQSQLTNLGTQKNTLSNAVKVLDTEVKKIGTDVKVTQNKISTTDSKLNQLGSSIVSTSQNIENLKLAVAKSIREMHIAEQRTLSQLLLSGTNISDVWHHAAAGESFRSQLRSKTDNLTQTRVALERNKALVESAKKELLGLQSQLKDQQTLTARAKAEKDSLLKQTQNQETAYQKLVREKLELKNRMEDDLRDYESQLSYILNPNSLPTTGSKTFRWPLDSVRITQYFGKTQHSQRLYVTGSHNGMDFGTPTGTPVKAMASGVVVGSGNTDLACKGASYGGWILIQYDNGLSAVFGHLSLVRATKGQRVLSGDIVAYSGNTGYSTGPHLHVSVWPADAVEIKSFPSTACRGKTITIPTAARNAYLDPLVYFPK
jgi:murein DD-endopeptidase MepM/ murein hydrolase activator NlpD